MFVRVLIQLEELESEMCACARVCDVLTKIFDQLVENTSKFEQKSGKHFHLPAPLAENVHNYSSCLERPVVLNP